MMELTYLFLHTFNYYPLIAYIDYTWNKSVSWQHIKKFRSTVNKKMHIHSLFPYTQQNENINKTFNS